MYFPFMRHEKKNEFTLQDIATYFMFKHRKGEPIKTSDVLEHEFFGTTGQYSDKKIAFYFKDGVLHNDDAPAFLLKSDHGLVDGEIWLRNGLVHRAGGEYAFWDYVSHCRGYCIDGRFCRISAVDNQHDKLPAYTNDDGEQFWFTNGKLGRDGDYAIYQQMTDTKIWMHEGQLHRIDGACVEYGKLAKERAGTKRYFLYNQEISEGRFKEIVATIQRNQQSPTMVTEIADKIKKYENFEFEGDANICAGKYPDPSLKF